MSVKLKERRGKRACRENTVQAKAPLISDYDVQIMLGLGVSIAQLRSLLKGAGIAPSPHLPSERAEIINPLSAKEIEVLKKGGARGLDQSPQPEETSGAIKLLGELVEECRHLVHSSLNLGSVADLLHISSAETKYSALSSPPTLHAFELVDGQIRFPQWQFMDSGAIPHLASILALTKKPINPIGLSRLMLIQNPDLESDTGSLCPRDWLIQNNNPEPVLELVRSLSSD